METIDVALRLQSLEMGQNNIQKSVEKIEKSLEEYRKYFEKETNQSNKKIELLKEDFTILHLEVRDIKKQLEEKYLTFGKLCNRLKWVAGVFVSVQVLIVFLIRAIT